MRPPSFSEQPAETKISATKASSAFALMVTVIRLPSFLPPHAKRLSYSHILVARTREARFSGCHDGGRRGRCQESGTEWGGLATTASKKGGLPACGAGGPAGVVHPAAGRDASAGDAVHALSAQ